jgi:hypothetical protein
MNGTVWGLMSAGAAGWEVVAAREVEVGRGWNAPLPCASCSRCRESANWQEKAEVAGSFGQDFRINRIGL